VAHEIKNPLTPMKLSVQHLQRSFNDGAPDWGDKLKRFSTTIIEQIDTLSTIASEFSNFANMPRARKEKVEITDAVRPAIDLYKDLTSVRFELQNHSPEGTSVLADREQLIRVFNNLVKNAGQAIPDDREGVILVQIRKDEKRVTVEVKDNGTGIPEKMFEQIFVPSFTTKTSGMGLGLAMVKNIVEGADGKIWFETVENEGTSFFVEIPLYTPPE